MDPWVDFAIVIGAQLLFLHAVSRMHHLRLKRRDTALLLAAGTAFGVAFDLLMGQGAGLFSYRLGFAWPFLLVNGFLSYGICFLTVRILAEGNPLTFFGWSLLLGIWYEAVNAVFPVWHWQLGLGLPYLEEAIVLLLLYPAFAWLVRQSIRMLVRARLLS